MERNAEYYMRVALREAEKAALEGEVPVGAVIVREGKVIAKGRNRREGRRSALAHAEIEAIQKACKKLGGWRLINCELYVTLEPCPMCAGAIINSRIEKVIYGCDDPKAGAVRSVMPIFDLPFNHRPRVVSGVLADECSDILKRFFKSLR